MSNAAHRFDNGLRRRPETHPMQVQLTPPYVLEPIRAIFGGKIGLDPCTETDNPTGAERFYCLPQDGCTLPWDADTIFINPPYGETRSRWVERAIKEKKGRKIILLLPAATDTRVFQKAATFAESVLFCRGRLKFVVKRLNGRQMAASHGSAIIGFNVDLRPAHALGLVVEGGGENV